MDSVDKGLVVHVFRISNQLIQLGIDSLFHYPFHMLHRLGLNKRLHFDMDLVDMDLLAFDSHILILRTLEDIDK